MEFSDFLLLSESIAFKVDRIPGKGRGLVATRLILGPHDGKPGETIIKAVSTKIDDADWQLGFQGSELERLYGLTWDKDHYITLGRGNDSFPFVFSDPKEWDRLKQTTLVKSRGRFANGLSLSGFNFINHSDQPNVRDVYGTNHSIEVVAIRDIPIGEEITKRYNKAGREAIFKIVR